MKKVVGLLAGLCLCAGCEDKLPEPTRPAVSAERFVVDYTAGVATRAIHENQTKGVRINSLTYLLYNSEGTLEKRREIPGLDGDGESWPLTRANMSWEQREALKDTLLQEETYHAVFVANIDSAICGWTDENGKAWSPLRETEKYETVHLQMPYQPFNDRNMFYLFTQEIVSTDQGADREKPYNCPVMLRRAVTRTDFWFEQLPVWEENPGGDETGGNESELPGDGTDEGTGNTPGDNTGENPGEGNENGEGDSNLPNEGTPEEGNGEPAVTPLADVPAYPASCQLPDTIKNYFLSDFYNMVLSRYRNELSQPVVDATVGLLTKLATYYGTLGAAGGLLALEYMAYADNLNRMINDIQGPGKTEFLDRINTDRDGDEALLSKFQTHLLYTLLNELAGNLKIRNFFTESQQRTLDSYATIFYEAKSGVQTYHLKEQQPKGNLAESLRMKADTTVFREGVSYLGFNWLGLADPASNKVSSVSWYQTKDATQPAYTLSVGNTSLSTNQEMNEKRSVLYRPMNELNLIPSNGKWKQTKETQIICNLKEILPLDKLDNTQIFDKEKMIADIEILLGKGTLIPGYQYPLEKMVLTIDYPDITNDEVLEIKSIWEITN